MSHNNDYGRRLIADEKLANKKRIENHAVTILAGMNLPIELDEEFETLAVKQAIKISKKLIDFIDNEVV